MPDPKKRWTVDEVRALPGRYEVIDGELLVFWGEPLSPEAFAWRHSAIVRALFLHEFFTGLLGEPVVSSIEPTRAS